MTSPGHLTLRPYAAKLNGRLDCYIGTFILEVHPVSQLYKSLVLPILDYCSSLWDPNYAIHVNKLESFQKLAARFVSGRWNDNYDSLLNRLNWSELSTRRRKQKLLLCNRIVKGYSILPPSFFTPHPFPHLRHNHSLPLYHPPCRSTAHLSSFSVIVLYHCGIIFP